MDESSALDQFVHEMGADLSVYIADHTPIAHLPLARILATARAFQVEERKDIVAPEWAQDRTGHIPSLVCMVWDRPTLKVAGHRTMLSRLLQGAGIHPEQTTHVWAYPYALSSPPLAPQIAAYYDATLSAIIASSARYVVLLGNVPISLWRPELRLQQVAGKCYVWDNRRFVYPLMNPIQVLVDRTLQSEYRTSIYHLSQTVHADCGMEELGTICVYPGCREDGTWSSGVYVYDPDGVPWCRLHYMEGYNKGMKRKKRQIKRVNEVRMDGMFDGALFERED